MKGIQRILITIGVIAILGAFGYGGYLIGRKGKNDPFEGVIRDTVVTYRIDTITLKNPPEIVRIPVGKDTVYIHDTVMVEVPREQVYYANDSAQVWVSGFKAKLDSLKVLRPTVTQTITMERTITKPAPRWSFGVSAGIGGYYGLIQRKPDIGVGVQVGVSYRF